MFLHNATFFVRIKILNLMVEVVICRSLGTKMIIRQWTNILMVLFLWCFTHGLGNFLLREKEENTKGTKYLFDIIRDSKPSDEIVDDSSTFEERSTPKFHHGRPVAPLKSVELDSEGENLSDYDDSILYSSNKNGGYLHDEPDSSLTISKETISDSEHSIKKSNGNHIVKPKTSGVSVGSSSNGESAGESEILKPSLSTISGEKLTSDIQSKEHDNGGEIEILDQQEKLLLIKLMDGYERDVRPVKKASQPVVIRVGITLTQIFDMDEKQQVLTTNVWLDQEWNDEMLRWNPKDYGGLETIRLPCDRIWLPDIVLYNNADDYTRGYMPSRAMVSYDGNVFWPPPTKFRSTCSVDVTYFPFDDQVCFLKLGSWTYNGFQVDVTNRTSAVDLSNYISNGEWELVKAVQQRNVVFYSCCPEPFPDVTITLVIRRKTLYYIYNIVLPCIMLSALTLLVFSLPPDSGEKIALGITVLLAFSVFMLAINESLPETSESIPLIGVYLTIVMAITSVSVIMTVVVLNLHYLGPQVRPVPPWLRCFLPRGKGRQIRQKSLLIPVTHREPRSGSLKRSHIFITQWRRGAGEGCSVEVPGEKLENIVNETSDASSKSITNENTENYSNNLKRPRVDPQSETNASYFNRQQQQNTQQRHSSQSGLNRDSSFEGAENNTSVFEELLMSIRYLINKQEEVEAQNNLVAEWRLIAQVVDRILFWIFFTFTVSSSTLILLILPIYKRNFYGSPLLLINSTDFEET